MEAIAQGARGQLSETNSMRKLGTRGLDWDAERDILAMIIHLADSEVVVLAYEDLRKRTNPDGPEGYLFVPVP
ncbi:hypothetical protein QBC32DRAFT_318967 [Pseudoneurospora amorphoporcata]|uniref:Uncharacterized protein n=1 Tax=Pseudoneurospora amorphoporcata TaxID=241081 RepID=A0AAN6NM06_9PEZI|nr:hypothetical protein QBC32DRAFT_318967 [Pseudoneurospora amorphoporcata]